MAEMTIPAEAVEAAIGKSRAQWPRVQFDARQVQDHLARVRARIAASDADCGALHLEDLCMATAIAHGDAAAWETCYREHQGRLLRLASASVSREDAEGVVQDLFAGLPAHIDRYDGRATLRTWLGAIVVNRSRDHFRKHDRRRVSPVRSEEDGRADDFDSDCPCKDHGEGMMDGDFRSEIDRDDCRALFRELLPAALGRMDPQWSLLLQCKYIDGMTNRAIAERVFRVPEYNVSRWLKRCLPRLGKRLLSAASGVPGGRERLTACLDILGERR